jgi:hypothetical protein
MPAPIQFAIEHFKFDRFGLEKENLDKRVGEERRIERTGKT